MVVENDLLDAFLTNRRETENLVYVVDLYLINNDYY